MLRLRNETILSWDLVGKPSKAKRKTADAVLKTTDTEVMDEAIDKLNHSNSKKAKTLEHIDIFDEINDLELSNNALQTLRNSSKILPVTTDDTIVESHVVSDTITNKLPITTDDTVIASHDPVSNKYCNDFVIDELLQLFPDIYTRGAYIMIDEDKTLFCVKDIKLTELCTQVTHNDLIRVENYQQDDVTEVIYGLSSDVDTLDST